MFVVFFVLDIRNPAMAWIDNRITKTLLIIFAISTMTLAINTLKSVRRIEHRQAERFNEQQRSARAKPSRGDSWDRQSTDVPQSQSRLQVRSYR
jgi:cell division protein FtsI/penicillin-binding protein 2